MKVFVRERRTGLYYTGGEEWTYNIAEAMDFKTGEAAARTANRTVEPVEIVYSFDNFATAFATPWASANNP